MLVFGAERCKGTPEEMDEISRWKYHRWRLAQAFPGMKPADFDKAGDTPHWLDYIDVSKYEIQDAINILNAQAKSKEKPKT